MKKKLLDFQETPLEGLHSLKTYANLPTLGFNTNATAGRAPVSYGKWAKRLKGDKCWANLQKPGTDTVPPLNPLPTQSHKW